MFSFIIIFIFFYFFKKICQGPHLEISPSRFTKALTIAFNAHTMILIVRIFMNANKLCLNQL